MEHTYHYYQSLEKGWLETPLIANKINIKPLNSQCQLQKYDLKMIKSVTWYGKKKIFQGKSWTCQKEISTRATFTVQTECGFLYHWTTNGHSYGFIQRVQCSIFPCIHYTAEGSPVLKVNVLRGTFIWTTSMELE